MSGAATKGPLPASSGVPGLDDVLSGAGKTTLALQFLMAGARAGEPLLYVTLSETAEELRSAAHSYGWSLAGVNNRELVPHEGALDPDEQNTLFHPSEVELASTTKVILEDVERLKPTPVRYRRQKLALKQFFATRDCTIMLPDDLTATDQEPFPRHRILIVDDNKDAAETALLIALTGWGQEHDQRRSAAAGFDHHAVNPADIDRLRRLFLAETSPSGRRTPSTH